MAPPPTGERSVDDDVPCHRPSNSIEKSRFEVAISSVHYQREQGIPICIVVLDVSFILESGLEVNALLPLDLKPHKDSSASASPGFYINSHFTGIIEEVMVMEQDTIQESMGAKSTAKVGTIPKRQPSLWGKKTEPPKLYDNTISLVGTRLKNNMNVQWTFRNETKEHHYPRNVRLMVTVKKTDDIRQLFFPFTLQLGSEFCLSVFGEGLIQKFKTKLSGPSGPQHIHIEGSWQPDIAKDMLTDVSNFYDSTGEAPQHIGLRAAFRTLSSVSPLVNRKRQKVSQLTSTQPERSDQTSTNQ